MVLGGGVVGRRLTLEGVGFIGSTQPLAGSYEALCMVQSAGAPFSRKGGDTNICPRDVTKTFSKTIGGMI